MGTSLLGHPSTRHGRWRRRASCRPCCGPGGLVKINGFKTHACTWDPNAGRLRRIGKCALFPPALKFESHILPASVRAAQNGACLSCTPCCELANNLFGIIFNPKTIAFSFVLVHREAFLQYHSSELILVQFSIIQFRTVPF